MKVKDFIPQLTLTYLQDRELTTPQVGAECVELVSSWNSSSEAHWKTRETRRLTWLKASAGDRGSIKSRPRLCRGQPPESQKGMLSALGDFPMQLPQPSTHTILALTFSALACWQLHVC